MVKVDLGYNEMGWPVCYACGEAISGFVVLCIPNGHALHEDPCTDEDDCPCCVE